MKTKFSEKAAETDNCSKGKEFHFYHYRTVVEYPKVQNKNLLLAIHVL